MANKLKTIDAETLMATPMSKTMFVVDRLIPQGVSVVSGASKIGKSWLMLWLGLQVAQGLPLWGIEVQRSDVLYLCLEDTERRIKDRLYKLTDSAPANLRFAVMCKLLGSGLEAQIREHLAEFPSTKLVIIDTLQKVRDSKSSIGKAGMYAGDYDDISSVKRIADEYNIAILLVHHLRKMADSSDPVNEIVRLIGGKPIQIHRLMASGTLHGVAVSGKVYCPKSEIIDYAASPEKLSHPNTQTYRELIRSFKKQQSCKRESEMRGCRRKSEQK